MTKVLVTFKDMAGIPHRQFHEYQARKSPDSSHMPVVFLDPYLPYLSFAPDSWVPYFWGASLHEIIANATLPLKIFISGHSSAGLGKIVSGSNLSSMTIAQLTEFLVYSFNKASVITTHNNSQHYKRRMLACYFARPINGNIFESDIVKFHDALIEKKIFVQLTGWTEVVSPGHEGIKTNVDESISITPSPVMTILNKKMPPKPIASSKKNFFFIKKQKHTKIRLCFDPNTGERKVELVDYSDKKTSI